MSTSEPSAIVLQAIPRMCGFYTFRFERRKRFAQGSPSFINDNYALLFPLKAYWDSSPAVIDAGMYNLPVGNGSAELVAVKYPAESRRLHSRRHLGTLRRQRQSHRVFCLPPRRRQETEPSLRNLGRPRKDGSSAYLY